MISLMEIVIINSFLL